MLSSELTVIEQAGFKFPASFGKSRHPFLDDNGQPRDPRTVGFELCTTGGGCMALCLEVGRFRIILTSECGGTLPEISEWETALINFDVDAYEPHGYDLACMTGLELAVSINAS